MSDRAIAGMFHLGGDADWTMETDPNLVDVFADEEEVTVLPTEDYIRLRVMLAAACKEIHEMQDDLGPGAETAEQVMARLEAETEEKALAYLGDRQDGGEETRK
jgi:hypothetical protein